MSSWLRDYLYIPLGGNRGGEAKTYRNLLLTMILGGLWHGAAFNFILWGIYQGAILCIHRLVVGAKAQVTKVASVKGLIWRIVKVALFFQVVSYGWLLFRANSWEQIVEFTYAATLGLSIEKPTIPMPPLAGIAGMGILLLVDYISYRKDKPDFYLDWPVWLRSGLFSALLFIIFMGLANERSAFIYFQF